MAWTRKKCMIIDCKNGRWTKTWWDDDYDSTNPFLCELCESKYYQKVQYNFCEGIPLDPMFECDDFLEKWNYEFYRGDLPDDETD